MSFHDLSSETVSFGDLSPETVSHKLDDTNTFKSGDLFNN